MPFDDVQRFVDPLPANVLGERRAELEEVGRLYLSHRFDLLGSGWVSPRHGMTAAGVEGHRYPPAPDLETAPLEQRLNRSNRTVSAAVRQLVTSDYVPIDWQLDYKSGYRWDEGTWSRDITYGDRLGADVKVPWELGRCQHLPQLALWAGLAVASGQREVASLLAREFRDEVLDFISANPPRYGVQWVTTMDVAIRISNWLLAHDLFRAAGLEFDAGFSRAFVRSVYDHGRHIATNLEWATDLRGNHYLADIAGLVLVAAYLPPTTETDAWLLFAVRELLHEIRMQFHDDGGSFEGSTCYHRLSAETAAYAIGYVLALPEARVATLLRPPRDVLSRAVGFPGDPVGPMESLAGPHDHALVPNELVVRMLRAREFTVDLTKHSGHVPQFGDNDSGRFFRLAPVLIGSTFADARARYRSLDGVVPVSPEEPWPIEDHLDHRHLVDLIDGLTGRAEAAGQALGVDGTIARQLARPDPEWAVTDASHAETIRIGDRHSLEKFERQLASLPEDQRVEYVIDLRGEVGPVETRGYPLFGVFVLRSPRVFLAVRCGPRGQNGFGGHDHNDQLTVELQVDGEDWIADPGTYLYTAEPSIRRRYRSAKAHFAPLLAGDEPAGLDEGPFRLGPGNEAECLYWGELGFAGRNRAHDGRVALCRVRMTERRVFITHGARHGTLARGPMISGGWREALPDIDHSPGYGIVNRQAPYPEAH